MNTVHYQENRNIGIDLLRIFAMFMVVMLHVAGHGGVIDNTVKLSASYEAAWLFDAFTTCTVNCFAIISGYVGIKAQYKYSNFAELWLRAVFFTVSITAVFAFFMPGGGNSAYMDKQHLSCYV